MYKILANTVFLGKDIIYLTECHSTNDEALERIRRREIAEGSVIITDHQTKGKGQRGNIWLAEKGKNLTFSIVLQPRFLAPSEQFYLNMVVSLSVARLLSEIGMLVKVKWPNDIMDLTQGKFGGILIENIINQKGIEYSVIGIGLNINQKEFELPKVTSLFNLRGKEFDLSVILERLIVQIEYSYLALKRGEFKKIKSEYLDLLYQINLWSRYDDGEEFEGKITGIDETGKLIIQKKEGGNFKYGLKEVKFLL